MKYWQREHVALLNALRASSIVPTLYRRLSLERFTPTDVEIRRLRDWAVSIRDDPGWTVISPVLDKPAAWPSVWDDAVGAGFGPRTDHHHALLFGRFCERFLAAQDFEGASWAFRQAMAAWARVFATPYPAELAAHIAPELPDREEVLRTMLGPLVAPRVENLRAGAGLAAPSELPRIDKRMLLFAWRALSDVREVAERAADPHGTLAELGRLAAEGLGTVNAEVLARFEKLGEEADLAEAADEGILGRFRWGRAYFEVVGHTEQAAINVVTDTVATCWALRRIDRDKGSEFGALLQIVEPFNVDLMERVQAMESAFGHNGQCADFLVFQGELEQNSDKKKEIFQRGLDICPGHRNSAMLLAWEMVRDAQRIVAQTALAPSLLSMVPGTSARVDREVRRAWELCDEAEAIYAFNENLPEARERIKAEAKRLKIEL